LVEEMMVGDRAGPHPRPHRARVLRAGAMNLKDEPDGCMAPVFILWRGARDR